jgi:hypothetical protein
MLLLDLNDVYWAKDSRTSVDTALSNSQNLWMCTGKGEPSRGMI